MKKITTILCLLVTAITVAQNACSYGTVTNNTTGAENISTGGQYEYTCAVDFDVPFGTIFTANQLTFNLTRGAAPIQYLNLTFRQEQNGLPGPEIMSFPGLVPTSETYLYDIPDVNMQGYLVAVDLPTEVILQRGKYFIQLSAAPGDTTPVGWEITSEEQTYGVFDYFKFADEPWGGTGYYNKVFQVIGTCADSNEVLPIYGQNCTQQNEHESYNTAATFLAPGGIVSVADDIAVPAGTTFHLTKFTMHSLLLGGGLHNATINIRSAVDGAPGPILHSFVNKGPSVEDYNGYHPFPGIPFDVVSVLITFSWEHNPIMLTEGNYFIEVIPTPFVAEFLTWEATSQPGIGFNSHSSFDQGNTWSIHPGYNLVFDVDGFCSSNLSVPSNTQSTVKFYPNPVNDILHFVTSENIKSITLYTMDGRELPEIKLNGNTAEVAGISKGIYMLKVQFENGSILWDKVIKN